MFCFLFLAPYARTTRYEEAMKRLFCLKAKNGLGRFAPSALPHYNTMYTRFFLHSPAFFPVAVGLLSRSKLRGTRGARLYTTAQDWVPGGLRGACSGRSKSRHLASNRGVAFRGARAVYDDGKTTCQLFCPCKGQQHGSNNRLKLSSVLQLRPPLLCHMWS